MLHPNRCPYLLPCWVIRIQSGFLAMKNKNSRWPSFFLASLAPTLRGSYDLILSFKDVPEMPTSPNEDARAHAVAPELTIDTKAPRFPGNSEGVHSPHFDHPMWLSPGHPLVINLSEERVSIPSFPFSRSPEQSVVSSMALEDHAVATPLSSRAGIDRSKSPDEDACTSSRAPCLPLRQLEGLR